MNENTQCAFIEWLKQQHWIQQQNEKKTRSERPLEIIQMQMARSFLEFNCSVRFGRTNNAIKALAKNRMQTFPAMINKL